eukprot:12185-Heterococcus_DN1.PRE.3
MSRKYVPQLAFATGHAHTDTASSTDVQVLAVACSTSRTYHADSAPVYLELLNHVVYHEW